MSEKGQPELEALWPLSSWVRTLNLDEGAAAVLDAAVPGMDLDEFEADADCWLHQEDPAYRKLLIKLIWDQFLARDDDGRIVNSAFLQLFKYGSLGCRHDLFYVRYGLSQPWTLLAAKELVAPARARGDAEGAKADAGALETADWDKLVDEHIDPARGPSSRKKTRGTVAGVLVQLGTLERVGRKLVARHGTPDPLAFAWTVWWELVAQEVGEARVEDLVATSAAAYIFAPTVDDARAALDEAVEKGLFTASGEGEGRTLSPTLDGDWSSLTPKDKPLGWASPLYVPGEFEEFAAESPA